MKYIAKKNAAGIASNNNQSGCRAPQLIFAPWRMDQAQPNCFVYSLTAGNHGKLAIQVTWYECQRC